MQTIKIQDCTGYKDITIKLFVNDEKLLVRNMLYNMKVDDDKPFKIRAKYSWYGSHEYTFEPKENMTLQILLNRRTINTQHVLHATAMILLLVNLIFFRGNFLIPILFFLISFCWVIYAIINRKKGLVIKEVNQQSTNDVKK